MRRIQMETGRSSRLAPYSRVDRAYLLAIAGQLVFAGLILAAFLLSAFGARAEAGRPRVSIDDVHAGSLLLRTDDPSHYVEAVRTGTDVALTVSGPTVRARVTQIFHNPSQDWVEGVYVYPLPDGAAVDTMKMVVGQRVIVADIKEKQEAKVVYERAKANGQRAALVEQQRPNMFTNSIANIGPGDSVVVQIEYQEPVRQVDDTFSLRVPLVVGPRFSPASAIAETASFQGDNGWGKVQENRSAEKIPTPPVLDPRANGPVNPVAIHIDLQAGFPLDDVKSAFHQIAVDETGPDSRKIKLADGPVPADRDFELTWTAKPGMTPSVGLFREHVGSNDYLLAFVTPPVTKAGSAEQHPRDVTFVIDNSGSMGGTSITQAKASLVYALSRLASGDRFNIIRFDNTMTDLFGQTVPASGDNLEKARAFVDALQASGGTVMVPPMLAALNDTHPGDSGYLRQVVFLTDGGIDNEQELFDAIASHRGNSRLFMVGIGSAPNSHLMTRAAELGGGTFTHIGSVEQVQERMKQLVDKLESPAMTNVDIAFSAGGADVTPRILPDLYHGETLVAAARLGALTGTAEISGTIGNKSWSVTLPVADAAEGQGLSKLWARRKIDDADIAQTLRQITSTEADKQVLALALDHHLVTRLTSLVAIDETPIRPRGMRLTRSDVPLNLPAGWDFDKVFGPSGDAAAMREQRPPLFDTSIRRIKTDSASAPSAPIFAPARQIALPQTATDAELCLIAGLTLLAAGLGLAFVTRNRKVAA